MRPSLPAARIMLSAAQHRASMLQRASRGFGPFLTRCMLCVLICTVTTSSLCESGSHRAQYTSEHAVHHRRVLTRLEVHCQLPDNTVWAWALPAILAEQYDVLNAVACLCNVSRSGPHKKMLII